MLTSLSEAERIASDWDVPVEDVALIALNHCGLSNEDRGQRSRIVLTVASRPEEQIHLILSLRRPSSPFTLRDDTILLGDEPFAHVDRLATDDTVLGYWRNGGRALTLNSNARSQCVGCAFCPNTLEDAADPALRSAPDLAAYFAAVAEGRGGTMSGVDRVTVCTGCFRYEQLALGHLSRVRALMREHGCDGVLHFLSSVLETDEGLDAAAELGPFHLTLTAECFTGRQTILKESKARLDVGAMESLLHRAEGAGLVTDFTYIVGLDPYADATRGLKLLAPHTTTFPRIQVYQAHTSLMDVYLQPEARVIDYYLKVRKRLEELFGATGLRPKPWENYRSLWYFQFGREPLAGARI
jgi:hypothetical protein